MIKLYTAATPNGRKVSIALEELGLDYETIWVHLDEKEQFKPEFLAMNPNRKIPVLDDDGRVVWESGAILLHLDAKYGGLLPADAARRTEALQFMFFQAAHIGPNLGRLASQINREQGEPNQEMIQIFLEECLRLFGVLDTVFADGRAYLAGSYSAADMMTYPWLKAAHDAQAAFFTEFPKLSAWMERVGARPAVARGMAVPE
jgi:GSH-dependent disulfide-bond oxidoreductase